MRLIIDRSKSSNYVNSHDLLLRSTAVAVFSSLGETFFTSLVIFFVCATLCRCIIYKRRTKPTRNPARPPPMVNHVRRAVLMFCI